MIRSNLKFVPLIVHLVRRFNYDAVSVLQKEVEVVEWARIFVLKSIQQALLNHSELQSCVVEAAAEAFQLVPVFKVYVYRRFELLDRQTLSVLDFVAAILLGFQS